MHRAVARFTAILAIVACALAHAADAPYDLVFRNARIVDGTGSSRFRGDLAVRGDTIARIARIAPSVSGPSKRVIDVRG